LLLANEEKSARERLTLIRVFEELRGLGYAGGYDAVRRYARAWRTAHGATYYAIQDGHSCATAQESDGFRRCGILVRMSARVESGRLRAIPGRPSPFENPSTSKMDARP
jgi:hypothetical protein